MSSEKSLPLPDRYKYQTETRTQREIELSNKLARALSELNLQRVRKTQISQSSVQENSKGNVQFFFVCISGIPPFQNEYQNLNLPGEFVVISLSGLKGKYTEQEYIQVFNKGGFEYQANKIRPIILKKSQQGKKIVIIYHSFGTFTFLKYLNLYGDDHRVSGMIDVGGASLRFYPLLLTFIKSSYQATPQFLLQNSEQIHDAVNNDPARVKAGFNKFENKYQSIIQVKLALQKSFQNVFEQIRHFPKVLKLFIYGSADRIFPEYLVNQKAIHYCYVDKLDPQYEQRAKKAYLDIYKTPCRNVQQRFIFCLEGGQHSIHMQKKYNQDVKSAIKQYLKVLSCTFE